MPPSTFVWDREIPIRSAIDFDFARNQLTTPPINGSSASASYYQRVLSTLINSGRGSRILAFNNQPRSVEKSPLDCQPPPKPRLVRPEGELDAPGLMDNLYLNLLSWGASNVIAIALQNTVYLLREAGVASSLELGFPTSVTSVGWDPHGRLLAVGLENSDVQLWDPVRARIITTLRGGKPIGSLSWSDDIVLTTGGEDGCVADHDLRASSHAVRTYRGHEDGCSVCGLEWSNLAPRQLASGGSDNLVCIWDRRNPDRWLHRLTDHVAGVRALAWCPFKDKLLATGGGMDDGCVRFWSTQSGASVDTVSAGSQVCSLLWSENSQELLTSCGSGRDSLALWAYPEMVRTGQLVGHTNRVLYMARSPDGCGVATASGGEEEVFRYWKDVFRRKAAAPEAFGYSNRILIRENPRKMRKRRNTVIHGMIQAMGMHNASWDTKSKTVI